MSSRVTRSAARQRAAADPSAATATTTSTSEIPQPTSARKKRKRSLRTQSPEASPGPTKSGSARGAKRRRVAEPEQPPSVPSSSTLAPSSSTRSKDKIPKPALAMAAPGYGPLTNSGDVRRLTWIQTVGAAGRCYSYPNTISQSSRQKIEPAKKNIPWWVQLTYILPDSDI